ncbi:hypothetical protein SASPL_128648 [Salvia splendens]|uniref:NB-ARC domain-containing protein n=1 Tax=Salvia splendens TaxID=180675 RepID=A0A8X8XBE7_SALSN|nr:uncharacterized protein LOC121751405 [Salvia splendens]XP_042002075.1 uncharacterized protein LOC121751405 [Salvia splendens]KAG6410586.1 hypothetical protein SASPL_128648 [Salvia splendens]
MLSPSWACRSCLFEFPVLIWVYVSQEFNVREVFLTILKKFTREDMSGNDIIELRPLVRSHLEKGRFLLFMDDVWTPLDWREIEAALPTNNKLGKVLITSRLCLRLRSLSRTFPHSGHLHDRSSHRNCAHFRGNTAIWALGWDAKLLAYVYGGILNSGMSFYLAGVVINAKGPVFLTAFNPLNLIIVAILSSFIFAEQMRVGMAGGAVVTVVGLYMVVWGKTKDHKEAEKVQLPYKSSSSFKASD